MHLPLFNIWLKVVLAVAGYPPTCLGKADRFDSSSYSPKPLRLSFLSPFQISPLRFKHFQNSPRSPSIHVCYLPLACVKLLPAAG